MNWYLIIYFVLGILIAFFPGLITNHINKVVDMKDTPERFTELGKLRLAIIVLTWTAIFTSVAASATLAVFEEKKIDGLTEKVDSLETRIKALEVPVDTVEITEL